MVFFYNEDKSIYCSPQVNTTTNSGDNSLRTACGGANGTLAQETFDAYAEKVAGLQTALEEQGKDFVFILTPYKTEVYSDKRPEQLGEDETGV